MPHVGSVLGNVCGAVGDRVCPAAGVWKGSMLVVLPVEFNMGVDADTTGDSGWGSEGPPMDRWSGDNAAERPACEADPTMAARRVMRSSISLERGGLCGAASAARALTTLTAPGGGGDPVGALAAAAGSQQSHVSEQRSESSWAITSRRCRPANASPTDTDRRRAGRPEYGSTAACVCNAAATSGPRVLAGPGAAMKSGVCANGWVES
jgi:hypothetical protein